MSVPVVEISAGNPPGGPKYGHLSFPLNPAFAAAKPSMDAMAAQRLELLEKDLKAFRASEPENSVMFLPVSCPQPGVDYETMDEQLSVRDGTMIGVRFYKPLKGKENKTGVWIFKVHGGGFVIGTHEMEEVENRYFAAAGYLVASIDYRLAPEFPFPYAVTDSYDALKWCIANVERLGVSKDKIVTAGGSAGGNLAIVTTLKARNEGLQGIIGTIGNIPATIDQRLVETLPEGKYELKSMEQNFNASNLDRQLCLWFFEQYLPNGMERQPEVDGERQEYHSPLLAKDLSGLPPTLIQIAGYDPLRDEGLEFAQRLREAGVKVELKTYHGLPHGFYMIPTLKESEEYWQAGLNFVRGLEA